MHRINVFLIYICKKIKMLRQQNANKIARNAMHTIFFAHLKLHLKQKNGNNTQNNTVKTAAKMHCFSIKNVQS